ncbi:MAG: hypothetical protein A2231_08700 [Candidatus Firestonebacteria bacterium RIFOXYA2_FULL_40_8]|nr:MAG: hypothetical protein A2231_08700 [Candidatus Firestonebacteria bacterium RIFOXYA2_FULL_40_8]
MLRDIILQNKAERDEYLSKPFISREDVSLPSKLFESKLIKVITGARRTGKSVFCFLLLKGRKFGYLNFDDTELLQIKDTDEIIKTLHEIYPEAEYYFFDEIQNLPGWELFVNKLQRRGYNLILTGSNSKLLSGELASSLTGRYIPVEIMPFSFKECLLAAGLDSGKEKMSLPEHRGMIQLALENYLTEGGYPEVVVNKVAADKYLETLFDAILLKDIVKRYRIRKHDNLMELAYYLMSNVCSEYSFTGIQENFGFKSKTTVQKYMRYLEDVYLMFGLNRFSYKVKEQVNTKKKLYILDNGFVKAKAFKFSPDKGHLLENAVFVELMRRGYEPNKDLFYHKNADNTEIDFVVRENRKISCLYQCVYDVTGLGVKNREEKSLIKASNELDCKDLIILTRDYDAIKKVEGKTINYVSFLIWLLSPNNSRPYS